MEVSLTWLMAFIKDLYGSMPEDLNCEVPLEKVQKDHRYYIKLVHSEADELWSFVRERSNVYYIRLVMHRHSRQLVAFHAGDRSRESARKLWAKIPVHIR